MRILDEFTLMVQLIEVMGTSPKTIDEIAAGICMSTRTAMRRIDKLQDAGFLIRKTGRHPRKFKIARVNTQFNHNLKSLTNVIRKIHRSNA